MERRTKGEFESCLQSTEAHSVVYHYRPSLAVLAGAIVNRLHDS